RTSMSAPPISHPQLRRVLLPALRKSLANDNAVPPGSTEWLPKTPSRNKFYNTGHKKMLHQKTQVNCCFITILYYF
ncbi:MAG: hypothetical protein K6T29_05690, partial [Peptococcaceae bacterium]|nr:hypothetical protein [Peptococcaceae bacterium]